MTQHLWLLISIVKFFRLVISLSIKLLVIILVVQLIVKGRLNIPTILIINTHFYLNFKF